MLGSRFHSGRLLSPLQNKQGPHSKNRYVLTFHESSPYLYLAGRAAEATLTWHGAGRTDRSGHALHRRGTGRCRNDAQWHSAGTLWAVVSRLSTSQTLPRV